MIKLKKILFIASIISIASCIEEYKPIIEVIDTNKYVVYGSITNQEGYQTVNISYATNTIGPQYVPISGCNVQVRDDLGNLFQFTEYNPGEYKTWINKSYLNIGTSYKIDIITPEGTEISSDYDIMPNGANIDSVYYLREDKPPSDFEIYNQGIQFYLDLKGSEQDSRYYKYTVKETWEYHAPFPRQAYYDSQLHFIIPEDSTKMTCWKTEFIKSIYTLSLVNLSESKYLMYPLNFVKNNTERLAWCYSLLVEQYALSEHAYLFHDEIKNNNYDNAGLYKQQPALVKGNLINITNPNQEILGYFFASSVSTKRIFIKNVEDLTLTYPDMCVTFPLIGGLRRIPRSARPAYIRIIDGYPYARLEDACVDCTVRGGTNIKPEFWPN